MINRKLKTGVCIFLIACVFSACSGDAKKENVGGCGFNIPTDMNGKTYEISQAYGDEMFPSKIIEIDDNDWSCKLYDFDRTNITDLAVTNKYVYAISNLNGVIYIEKCPINGGKKI